VDLERRGSPARILGTTPAGREGGLPLQRSVRIGSSRSRGSDCGGFARQTEAERARATRPAGWAIGPERIGGGSRAGTVFVTDSSPNSSFTNGNVDSMLKLNILDGTLIPD